MSKENRVGGLGDLNHGEANRLFSEELRVVLENIADDEADWKLSREITIKVRIKPVSDRRDKVVTSVTVASKLAPRAPEREEMAILASGEDLKLLTMAEGSQMELSDIMEEDRKVREEGYKHG